jgi:hypothetical protein
MIRFQFSILPASGSSCLLGIISQAIMRFRIRSANWILSIECVAGRRVHTEIDGQIQNP